MFERFFSELKQRNVIRVAGIYVVTAWGLFQIVKTVFDTLGAPPWAAAVTLVALAIGLPIAVIIAWAFERGPDGGVRRTEAGSPDTPRARIGMVEALLLAGVVVVIGLTVLQITGVIGTPGQSKATALAAKAPEKSVAVLPFVSFSANPDNEYFADGLTEEVINGLAQIPDLKVAGRTSVLYFKGRNEDLREVGRKLGVSHVVEGSVRREGDRLRVTAQLVTVADGFHVWSKTYDRSVNDAFAIQSEIAVSVADALKTRLAVTTPSAAGAARDPQAYKLELMARAQYRRLGRDDLLQAREKYRQLIRMEPGNPAVHAGFAQTTILLAQNHLALDFDESRRESEAAIKRALELDPNSTAALGAQGMLDLVLGVRTGRPTFYAQGEAALRRLIAAEPRNADALALLANVVGRAGRPADAVTFAERALEIDPLNRLAQGLLASALRAQGRFPEAERQYRSLVELYPDYVDTKLNLAETLMARGAFDLAEPWLAAAAGPGGDASAAIIQANYYMNLGLQADAEKALAGMTGSDQERKIGRLVLLVVRNDWAAVRAYARQQATTDGDDPWWRQVSALSAIQVGDYEAARRELYEASPETFQPVPVVGGYELDVPLEVAHVLKVQGDVSQAQRVLQAILKAAETAPGVYASSDRRLARVKAYAELGDRARAIAELKAAIAGGWRSLYDGEDFMWLDTHFNTRSLHNDPEFKALVAQVRADLAVQRARVLARRGTGARPAA